jgi:hypothetical protein
MGELWRISQEQENLKTRLPHPYVVPESCRKMAAYERTQARANRFSALLPGTEAS